MKDKITMLREMIDESKRIVFFGGAGVSTESNIPDFRSEAGLYKAKEEYGLSPEDIISRSYFIKDPETFFSYYKTNMVYPDAQPNPAHLALARLEKAGKLSAIITQNIDGLHQRAGSEKVFEVHGSVNRNICMDCKGEFDLAYILDGRNCNGAVPICNLCGGIVKPDVVLYEEPLDDQVISGALDEMGKADMLIVGGTSLVVYPAASFVEYFNGYRIALINKGKVGRNLPGALEINEAIGQVLEKAID